MILIVRHGARRGRLRRYLDPTLEHLHRERAPLARALRVHDTGDPPPSLDGVVAVVFALGDPLREWYPHCYAEAAEIAAQAKARDIALFNPPDALSNSIKSVQARLWRGAGIPTPEHHRFESADGLRAILARTSWPVIVRPDEAHAQQATFVCREFRQAEAVLAQPGFRFPGSLTPLLDTREGYRGSDPGGVFARYYHKKRVVVMGPVLYTDHVFFSKSPIVASETCTFQRDHRARFPSLLRLDRWHRACVRADVDYWREGVRELRGPLMQRAVAALGLQLAAIDYSDLADGSVLLWEANPHFYVPPDEVRMLPRARHTLARNATFHDAFGDFFEGILSQRQV